MYDRPGNPINDKALYALDDFWYDHCHDPNFWHVRWNLTVIADGDAPSTLLAGTYYLPAGPWVTITIEDDGTIARFSKKDPRQQ